jgi:hypothetical protein
VLAYVHIYKTAGTTFTGILRRNFSIRHFDTRLIQEKPAITAAQLKQALILYPRVESIAGHAVRTYSDLRAGFPEIRFHTFMREPRRRIISHFLFVYGIRIRKGEWRPETDGDIEHAFNRFIERSGNGCCRILAPDGGGAEAAIEVIEKEVDFVGLVEHFDESLALFRNWIGRPDFDLRYRRLNAGGEASSSSTRDAATSGAIDRLLDVTGALAAQPDIVERMRAAQSDDIALYEHASGRTFERMRRAYAAGPGPFDFEDDEVAADSVPGRIYRNIVGRPFVHLVARKTTATAPARS